MSTLSLLCPTEDRPEFMPWLAHVVHRIGRERGEHDVELVLVDSSTDPVDMETFDGAAQVGVHVRRLKAPHGANVGAKFQQALEASEGDYVTLVGDDDWQNPGRYRRALSHLDKHLEQAWYGWRLGWFFHLKTMEGRRYLSDVPTPSTLVVRRAAALAQGFRGDLPKASDSAWGLGITGKPGAVKRAGHMADVTEIPALWFCHDQNMSNRPDPKSRWYPTPFELVHELLEDDDQWTSSDTDALASLRGRLGYRI